MTDAPLEIPRAASWCKSGLALATLLLGLSLSGCGSLPLHGGTQPAPPSQPEKDGPPINPPNVMNVPDAVPRVEPRSRYGNPDAYTVMGEKYRVLPSGLNYVERGGASWYGTKFHGQRTSSGEPYDLYGMTAAHRTLPIPSYARVTNLANNKSVVVRINDRGPFHSKRIIDLSYTAAVKLGIYGHGTGQVEVRAIDPLAAMTAEANADKSSAPGRSPRRTDTRAPAAASRTNLYLQVGAFSKHSNASNLVSRLQRAEFSDLRIAPSSSRKTTVYRVLIGPLASAEDAERMSTRLSRVGIELPQIVKD
jgi:rare lipoprotein A